MYRVNPNVLCTDICGKYLLVAARTEWDHLPYVQEINEQAAYCWQLLSCGYDRNAIEEDVCRKFSIDITDAKTGIDSFINQLLSRGYILSEEPCHG